MMWLKTLLRRWLGIEELFVRSYSLQEIAGSIQKQLEAVSVASNRDFHGLEGDIAKLRTVIDAQEQAHRQQPRQARTFREVQQFMGSDDAN